MKTSRLHPMAIETPASSILRLTLATATAAVLYLTMAPNAFAQHGGHGGGHAPSFSHGPSFSHAPSPPRASSFSRAPSASHVPFHTQHWAFDGRFDHNHFYPALGYSIRTLPAGRLDLAFGRGHYFFHAGVWYQHRGPNFVVVRPPIGIFLPILPPDYATLWVDGIPYYYANDIYYVPVPNGYQVVPAPADASIAPTSTSSGSAPDSTANISYYCKSSQSYYPAVSQCPEGWQLSRSAPQAS